MTTFSSRVKCLFDKKLFILQLLHILDLQIDRNPSVFAISFLKMSQKLLYILLHSNERCCRQFIRLSVTSLIIHCCCLLGRELVEASVVSESFAKMTTKIVELKHSSLEWTTGVIFTKHKQKNRAVFISLVPSLPFVTFQNSMQIPRKNFKLEKLLRKIREILRKCNIGK